MKGLSFKGSNYNSYLGMFFFFKLILNMDTLALKKPISTIFLESALTKTSYHFLREFNVDIM